MIVPSATASSATVSDIRSHKRHTQQRSIYASPNDFSLGNANDGDTNSRMQTNNGPNEFWMVDLDGTYSLTNINITNLGDCCYGFLKGATVEVLNKSVQVIWSSLINTSNSVLQFTLPPRTSGSFVRVRNQPGQYLSMNELVVYGR